jgi:hypothetical protein
MASAKAAGLYLFIKYTKITGSGRHDDLNMNNPDPNMKILIV